MVSQELAGLSNLRFGKMDGFDAFIATRSKSPCRIRSTDQAGRRSGYREKTTTSTTVPHSAAADQARSDITVIPSRQVLPLTRGPRRQERHQAARICKKKATAKRIARTVDRSV